MTNNKFELTLDTVAPTGSITRPAEYLKTNGTLSISKGDASYMKLWFDNKATGAKTDAGYTSASVVNAATSATTAFTTNGVFYYHMVLIDDVGNESAVYNTARIVYDTVAPVLSSSTIAGGAAYTTTRQNLVALTFTDATSGVKSIVFTCADLDGSPITVSPTTATSYTGTLTFSDAAKDGTKVISVKLIDNAGNEFTKADAMTIFLDATAATGTISVKNTDGEAIVDGSYINYTEVKPYIELEEENDVVGFKVWGDLVDHATEPTSFTTITEGTELVDIAAVLGASSLSLTSGNGEKTIHVSIIDKAGNITDLDNFVVNLYSAALNVTLSSDKRWINRVDAGAGAPITAVLAISVDFSAEVGIKEFALKVGSSTVKSEYVTEYDLQSTANMVEGDNTITVEAVDNAGNSGSATVTVGLDTTAPALTIVNPSGVDWHNAKFPVTVTTSDVGAGVDGIYVWTNTTAVDTTVPASATKIVRSAATQEIGIDKISWNLAQSEGNYIHVCVVDAVENRTFKHQQFKYDSVKPTATVSFSKAAYASTAASITVTAGSSVAPVSEMKITGKSGDIVNIDTDFVQFVSTKGVTLTAGDGNKQITVVVRDAAGNESDPASAVCELDTVTPVAALNLFNPGTQVTKDDPSNIAKFDLTIAYTDEAEPIANVQYKLYGDFTFNEQQAQGITEESAPWQPWPEVEGPALFQNAYCTTGDGLKTVYLKIKDNAGNISSPATATFNYDTEVPVADISDNDYLRVSFSHTLRRKSATVEETGKYNDFVSFTLTPQNSAGVAAKIQAYKICAYLTRAAAETDTERTGTVIGTTHGSVNMSATGLESSEAISCMINGKDYAIALGGDGESSALDGSHVVVAYVQDLAGNWSAVASFDA